MACGDFGYMGIDVAAMSAVMSISGYVGIFCALAAGGIVFKLGARKAATIFLVLELIGAVICAATSSYEMLFIGRIFEGIGFQCIPVIIPVIIPEWFPRPSAVFLTASFPHGFRSEVSSS